MGDVNFVELLMRLQSLGVPVDSDRFEHSLKECGIAEESLGDLQALIERIGLELTKNLPENQEKEALVSMINQVTEHLDARERQQIGAIVEQTVKQLGGKELPQEFADFLENWKKLSD